MAIKNSPGYNTFLSCFISFLIIKRYKMTRMNIEISPIGMNGYVIIVDIFFCFSFVVYGACIMAANGFGLGAVPTLYIYYSSEVRTFLFHKNRCIEA
jgi:hypothetical protein